MVGNVNIYVLHETVMYVKITSTSMRRLRLLQVVYLVSTLFH
jgi:hypothetical protein